MWVVVLRVPDGGALVLDSESLTLSSVQNAHLFIQTPSANRSIFVMPHGTRQVVVHVQKLIYQLDTIFVRHGLSTYFERLPMCNNATVAFRFWNFFGNGCSRNHN